jgi:hypothetical protein
LANVRRADQLIGQAGIGLASNDKILDLLGPDLETSGIRYRRHVAYRQLPASGDGLFRERRNEIAPPTSPARSAIKKPPCSASLRTRRRDQTGVYRRDIHGISTPVIAGP